MHLSSLPDSDVLLDVELCRAMFEKNPDKLLELVSDSLQVLLRGAWVGLRDLWYSLTGRFS